MNEVLSSPEQKREITREEVINAFRKFVERGITRPDSLDSDDPEVKIAFELFEAWQAQEDAKVARIEDLEYREELEYRLELMKTMFFVEAGFDDPDYLDEVLAENLEGMDEDVEEQVDNPERVETRRQIAEAQEKIEGLLDID